MRNLMLFIVLTTLALTSAVAASGAQEGEKPYSIPEMIVTDTKIAQPQSQVTQKVETFYAEDFDHQTTYNRNISELLKYSSGQFVNPLSRNDANWGSFGGLGPKYNGYLLDGLPIDSFADAMSLDPWAFERVELHKGPASVMYPNYLSMDFAGNEAPLAGITNFILKDKIDSPATRILLGYGSYNTYNARVFNQGSKGNFHYFLGANYEQSDYTNYGTEHSWLNMIDDPEYKKTKIYGKLAYFFNRDDHKLSLFLHHTEQTGDAGRPNRDFDHSYDTVNATYFNQITENLNLQAKTGYRNYDRRWGEDNYPTNLALREHDGVEQKIYPSDLTLNFRHLGNSILTFGTDFQVATYKTYSEVDGDKSTGNDATARSIGVFLQEKYVYDKWVFRAGGRFNYTKNQYDLIGGEKPGLDDQSWDKLLWSVGVRYNATPRLAIYANSGSSFVTPSAKSVGGTLKASDEGVAGKNGQLPNPDLKAESGIGSDLGIDLQPLDTLKIGIRGFYNYLDDAIVDNVISQNPSQTKAFNAGTARSYGVEVTAEQAVTDYFQWFANLTYTKTKVENSVDNDQDGTELSFVPEFIANVGISAKLPFDFRVSPYLQIVGDYYDSTSKSSRNEFGSYEVVNMKLEKSILKTDAYSMTAAVDLNNLFNKKYEMPWQFQDPGFNAMGSLEWKF
jgi:iron complex outermembrane recepter protein